MNRVFNQNDQEEIDRLNEIIAEYDKNFIEIAKTFVPEHEIQAKLMNDPHRQKMLEVLFNYISNFAVTYYQ